MTTPGKRILLLATGLNLGGAETQVFHLTKGLLSRGWQAEVASLLGGGIIADRFRQAGIPVHELDMKRGYPDPRAAIRLRGIILAFRPDIVHSHMVHANLLARLTRLICPMPALVSTSHSMIDGGRWIELACASTDRLSDLTTTISKAAAERHTRVGSVPKNRVKVVANGLPVEHFRPDPKTRAALRQELGIEDQFVWLAVGRFEAPKDYPNLVDAIRRSPSQRDIFLIAGDGPLRVEIERLAAKQGVSHRVRFLGIRTDVPALMTAADAYVMSSAWEGLPMVLLEASASALPIVATDVGGNCEIVRHGVTGFLVPPHDSAALAGAMQRMEQQSLSARAALGAAGREFVVKNYSLSSVLDEWESIYHSFIKKPEQTSRAQAGSF
jgi:glycosyltransferase involved in cell wall biosynthesis